MIKRLNINSQVVKLDLEQCIKVGWYKWLDDNLKEYKRLVYLKNEFYLNQRKELMNNGRYNIYKHQQKNKYMYDKYINSYTGELECSEQCYNKIINDKQLIDLYLNYKPLTHLEQVICERTYKASSNRQNRLNKRIKSMLKLNCPVKLFITFTLNNENISKDIKLLRKHISNFFKKNNAVDYVANVDYGKKNGRLHFHAVAVFNSEIDLKAWSLGAINIEHIRIKDPNNLEPADYLQLSRYINKLTNHALKKTASNLITKRGVVYDY